MPSQDDVEQMKRVVKDRLGFEDKSEMEMLSDEEIERAYNDLIGESETEEGAADSPEEERPMTETSSESPDMPSEPTDAITQYRLLLQQAHEMAKEWADRLGDDYAPFVESSGTGLVYGAENRRNSAESKFSELAVPEPIRQYLDASAQREGVVYRWALAEYQKLLNEAKQLASKRSRPRQVNIKEEHGQIRIPGTVPAEDENTITIPSRIQKILNS